MFSQFDLSTPIQRGIEAAGFTSPRPIQRDSIPAALEGRDILGLAQTGTGKTAAFALPILQRLSSSRAPGPRALIVAPTRELAAQITDEIRTLARFTKVQVATLFGGVSAHSQKAALARNPEIVVACPGRLLDLRDQGLIRLDRIEVLVLDEADHMFDMGFLPDIRKILAGLPERRQNLLFSATMPPEIRRLADGVLRRPTVVDLGNSRPVETIAHAIYPVDETHKKDLLARILDDPAFVSAIVFTRTKHRAKRLALQLAKAGHRAVALQGNMSQNQRERAMGGFRKGSFDILVATDIAARGIDVEQVSHVISFDMPNTPDAYTHRIGRTGRSEREGRAFTFVVGDDLPMVRAVEKRIGAPIQRKTVEGVPSIPFDSSRSGQEHAPRGQASRPEAARAEAGSRRRRPRRKSHGTPAGGGHPGQRQRNASGGGRQSGNAAGATASGHGRSGATHGAGSGARRSNGNASSAAPTPRRRRRRRPRRKAS